MSSELRNKVRLSLEASRVAAFYEYFDGEHLSEAVNKLLALMLEEYEREPDGMSEILDKMYERLQT